MGKRAAACKFPVARIKKIMQANDEIGKVSAATPVAICESRLIIRGCTVASSVL